MLLSRLSPSGQIIFMIMALLAAPLMLPLRDIVAEKDNSLRTSLLGYDDPMNDAGNELAVGVL